MVIRNKLGITELTRSLNLEHYLHHHPSPLLLLHMIAIKVLLLSPYTCMNNTATYVVCLSMQFLLYVYISPERI